MGAFADGSILGLPRRATLLAGTGLVSLFAAGLTVVPRTARAQLPTGGQVTAGQATITQTGANRLDINQTSGRAAIDWRGFSIGAGNVVHFQQPGSSAIALNRVTGADPSVIAGQLSATGRVVLINPNGIAFTQGANVDTAGLVASTLNISNGDFMAGRMTFSAPAGSGGSVVNEGTITVRDGGLAALVAPEVRNGGTIRARMGRVVLAGAESVTLDPRGDGLISFEVARSGPQRETRASNTGRIEADGGSVTIAAASARGIVAGVVNVDGVVAANSVGQVNGVVTFGSGEAGTTTVSGTVEARGNNAGERGGRIAATGEQVRFTGTARADASGRAGGGEIRAGGGVQGRGPEQNARRTTVERGAVLKADAIEAGRGGSVVVWSDEYTRFMGAISARGGASGGDGGFAEVSGRIMLDFDGVADLRGPLGGLGTLLLDPTNISIVAAPGTTTNLDGVPGAGPDRTITPTTAADTATLLNTQLQAMLNAANVTLTTTSTGGGSGTITVDAPVTWTTGSTLTLTADAGITVNAAMTASAGNGSLTLDAQGAIALNAAVNLGSGTLRLTSNASSITQGATPVAAITAGEVRATVSTGNSGVITLGNEANSIAAFGGSNPNSSTFLTSNRSFEVRGITASALTLTATSGSITQAAGAANALVSNNRVIVAANAGSVTLNNAANAVPQVNISALGGSNGISYRSAGGFAVGSNGGIGAPGQVSLTADAGNITQGGAVSAASLVATATAGNVELGGVSNPVGAVTATAGPAGTVALQTSGALEVRGVTAPGGVSLTANAGDITQGPGAGNRIVADALTATANAGSVRLGNAANEVGGVGGSALGATPTFRLFNALDLDLATVQVTNAGTLDIQLAGGRTLTVSGAPEVDGGRSVLVADTIALGVGGGFGGARPATVELRPASAINIEAGAGAAEAGALVLPTATLDALAPAGGGSFRIGSTGVPADEATTGRITITGYNAGGRTLRLESGTVDGIRQSAAITAGRIEAIAPLGPVALGSSSNTAGAIAGQSLTGFTFRNTAAFQVDGIAAPGQAVTLTADSGAITQAATGGGITALSVAATATAGNVTLDGAGNDATTVQGSTGAGLSFTFVDVNAIANGAINTGGGTVALESSGGTVTAGLGINASLLRLDGAAGVAQSGPILVGSVVAQSENGAVLLDNAGNTILRIEGGTGAGGGAFTVNALGALTVGNAAADVAGIAGGGDVRLTAIGNVTVAEALRAGTGGDLLVQTASGGTLAINAALAAPGGSATFVADAITGAGGFADADRPNATVIRPRSAGTSMGVGTGAPGSIQLSDAQVLALAPTDLATSTYRLGSVGRAGEVNAGAIRIGAVEFGNREVTLESGAAGVAISDVGAFNAGGIIARAPLGSVDLGGFAHQVEALGVTTLGDFSFASPDGFQVRGIIATGNVTLSAANGDITQAAGADNRIVANTLDATASNGSVVLGNTANAVGTVTGAALGAGGSFGFTDSDGLTAGAVSVGAGGRIDLRAGPAGTLAVTGALAANGGTLQLVADTLNVAGFGGLVGSRPTAVTFRTASAGRAITAGNLVGGGLELPTFNTLLLLRPADGGTLRIGSDGAGGAEAASGSVTIGGLSFLTLGRLELQSGAGTIGQTGAIGGVTALDARAAIGNVNLGLLANGFTAVSGSAGIGGFTVGAANALEVRGISAPGGVIGLTTAAGTITQAAGVGGAITGAGLVANAGGSSVVLTNTANAVGSVGGGGLAFTFVNAGDLSVSGINATAVTLSGGGTIGQTGGIVADTLQASAAGTISLDGPANDVGSFGASITGGAGNVRFTDLNGFTVAGITAPDTVSLVATSGSILTGGAIVADALNATTPGGSVVLNDGGNTLGRFGATAAGGVTFLNGTGFEITGISAAATNVQAVAGSITQSGAIATGALVANAGQAVTLGNPLNDAASIGGSAGTGFTFTDATGFTVTGLSAGTAATLSATAGSIAQSAAIAAPILTVSAGAGAVALDTAPNEVGTLFGTALGGFAFTDASALAIGGLSAGSAAVTAAGDLTQAGAVTIGGLLSASSTGGAVTLGLATNQVGAIGGAAAGGFTFAEANGFAVAGISAPGQAVGLTATTGGITQTGAVTAAQVTATAGGSVALDSAGNAVGVIAGTAGNGFTFVNGGGVAVAGIDAGAGAATLTALGGDVTQSAAIAGAALAATASGSVLLELGGNEVAAVGGAAGGSFRYRDATGFDVTGIAAPATVLTAGGGVTQTGAITGNSLAVTATGPVALTRADNELAGIGGSAGGGFAYTDATGFAVTGITAGTVTLNALGGGITQLGAIVTPGQLTATATGSVALGSTGNDAGAIAGAATGGFAFGDANGFDVAGISVPGGAITLTALGGAVTQSAAMTASTLAVTAAGNATLDAAGNAVAQLSGTLAGAFVFQNAGGFDVAGLTAGDTTLTALAGSITQSAPITAAALVANAAGGAVTLTSAGNDAASIAGQAAGQFAFTDANGVAVAGITAGSTTLVALGGDLTQTGAIGTGALSASATGAVQLTSPGNDAASIAGTAGGAFAFTDSAGIVVAGITAASTTLAATAGDVTQSAAIATGALSASAGGNVVLDNAGNDAASIAGQAGNGFTFRDANGFDVAGIGAASLVLDALGGGITQSAALSVPSVTATATGDVLLQDAGNDAATIAGSAGGLFAFTDATGFATGSITAGSITLQALGGDITQTAPLVTGLLSATASGAVTLEDAGNNAARIAGGGGSFSFRDQDGFEVAGINATGAVALTADTGSITQSAAITGASLAVNAPAGDVALTDAGNDVATLSGSAGGSFAYRDATGLAVGALANPGGDVSLRAGGTLALTGDVSAPGFVVRLQAGGDLTQAAPNGITAAQLLAIADGEVDLAGRNRVGLFAGRGAEVTLRNAQTLIVGSVAGDATVGGGATQNGVAATGAGDASIVRIILADPTAPGTPLNLTVNQAINAQRIHLGLATGGGTLRANPNLLRGAGGGDPGVVMLDVTGMTDRDVSTLPTFSGLAGTPPNVPVPITLGPNANGNIELTSQIMPGTSLYILLNGGLASSNPSTISVRGLAVYTGTLGTTRVSLFGFVNGQSGSAAATQSGLSIDANDRFTINNCPIGTISCVVLPTTTPNVPRFPEELTAGTLSPRIDESTLVFVNVGAEDSGERDEERRVAVGRPAPRQE
jgi:filamentous hemagglutinin family protein